MRFHGLLSEVWADVSSGTAKAFFFGVVLTLGVAMLLTAEAAVVGRLADESLSFQARGASTLTIVAPSSISGRACEAMSDLSNVSASGALRARDGSVAPILLPANPIPVSEVTPGFLQVVGSQVSSGNGVVVSDEVAEALLAQSDKTIATSAGRVFVGGTFAYPSDGRRPGFGWALLSPVAADGAFDECWVRVWPWSDEVQSVLKSIVLKAGYSREGEAQVVQTQLNTQMGQGFDGGRRFSERFTRGAAPFALLLGALIGGVAVRVRRLDYAARLHDGMSKTDVITLGLMETLTWSLPGLLFALGGSAVAVRKLFPSLGWESALGMYAITGAALVGVLGGALASLALVRERHLFRYFKDR